MISRLRWIILLAFASPALAAEGIRRHVTPDGSVIVAGKLDTSSIPYRLFVRPGQMNQEMIFVRGLGGQDSFVYDGIRVVIQGQLETDFPHQFMLRGARIREARPGEVKEVFPKRF